MRRLLCFVLLALALAAAGVAQEKLTLSTAVFTSAGATDFRVESIYLKRDTGPDRPAQIRAIFREVAGTVFVPNGRELLCLYDGVDAETRLRQLNVANFSLVSLERQVTKKCQDDGKLGAGTISGVPQ